MIALQTKESMRNDLQCPTKFTHAIKNKNKGPSMFCMKYNHRGIINMHGL